MLVWEEDTASGIKQLFAPVKKKKKEKVALREICWKMQRIIWPYETSYW